MIKRFFILIYLLSLSILLTGCTISQSTTKTEKATTKYETDIATLIQKNTNNEYQDLIIKEINTNNNSAFVLFLVNNKQNVLYEGLAYIEKEDNLYKLVETDLAQADINTPFTRHSVVVTLADGRNCILLGGIINDKNIKEIQFEYKDNTIKVLKIGENQKTYLEYIIGDIGSVKEIIGYDNNNSLIYSYK
jgi:hypothetical protein